MDELIWTLETLFLAGTALLMARGGQVALGSWVALQGILANIFALKEISLFGFCASAGDPLAVGALFSLSLFNARFGRKESLRLCLISLGLLLLFAAASRLHLLYTPHPSDLYHQAYAALLTPAPRLLLASIAAFAAGQAIDLLFMGLLGRALPLPARIIGATLLGTALDTAVFSLVGLRGILPHLAELSIVAYLGKLLGVALSIPFSLLARRWTARGATV